MFAGQCFKKKVTFSEPVSAAGADSYPQRAISRAANIWMNATSRVERISLNRPTDDVQIRRWVRDEGLAESGRPLPGEVTESMVEE
jgi:hypothetical protein